MHQRDDELDSPGMVVISPKSGVCIPPKVLCSMWRYFEVSVVSQVSVRIEEAFQIHLSSNELNN